MALKNMSLLASATVSASGGSALAFVDNGVTIANGVQICASGDTDFQTRRLVTAKYKAPALNQKTNTYGKDKKSLTLVKPLVLSSGVVVFQTLRIEREVHPSQAAADNLEMNKLGAQLLIDTDLDNFWATGSLS